MTRTFSPFWAWASTKENTTGIKKPGPAGGDGNLDQISIYQLISKVFGMRMQHTMHILVFKPFGSSHK